MKKEIPIWDNYERYLPELQWGILGSLLAVSDADYQRRVWLKGEGPEVSESYEASISFDEDIQWFKKLLRQGDLKLDRNQIKAILRVHAMWNYFDAMMMKDPKAPEGYNEFESYLINHPYWEKVRQQAQYALSLIEVNKTNQS